MQVKQTGVGADGRMQSAGNINPYKKILRMVQTLLAITIAAIAALVTLYYLDKK